ncbi:gamma-aminobutyric acid receptor subunit beta isoform X5 [Cimex lectularius]|uniref:Gamma-aminobutyric acid receptor subunit beta n=1 Tax=Cimex lectularius TaxID=79782 RepID=A0A8I6SU63_CIMLE|nr:gamma-aminobutyric acid receptor subunit beta isoform X5 [Cimex lectularius]
MRSALASWAFLTIAIAATLIAPSTRAPFAQAAAGSGGSMLGDVNISAILDSFSVSYDKRVRPNYGGPPVEVGVTMYVLSISSVSEVLMDFTLDFYFRQFWTDPRLAFRKQKGVETLSVGSEFIKNIWVPDTFFVNEKQSYFHIATTSNEFIRIHHSGSITRSIRLTITASCPMNLQYFPMDRQLCHIEIESFGYTMRDIRYKWNAGPKSVGIANEVQLPQFRVLGHRQRATEINLSTGNYSRLACEIQFVRSMGYYLIQIYIPSGLIVIISWVSFWLNRNATPARVALGVTTVLTMTTLMSSTNAALPKISYVKSIDVYLGTCFVMVFASLLEYATVGYMAKRIQMRKNRFLAIQKLAQEQNQKTEPHPPGGDPDHAPKQTRKKGHQVQMRDPSIISSYAATLPPSKAVHQERRQQMQQTRDPTSIYAATLPPPKPVHPERRQQMQQTEVRYKVHDPKAHFKGGKLENTINGKADDELPPLPPHILKPSNNICGITPSGIDMYSRIVFPEVRYKVHDPKAHFKGGTLENTINGKADEEGGLLKGKEKDYNHIYGITPSGIDMYSRIVFPVCFVCFNLMYWIIYLHISDVVADDLVFLEKDK